MFKPDADETYVIGASCMSTKQNCKSHCGKTNVSQNTRLIDRTTEILLTFKKSLKEETKLPPNSKIQDFTSIRYVPFAFANRQKVSAPFGRRISL